ncbi:uncharacterized protein LOC34622372 [Cyclospora cayetanensis]|uniref:Uncharacterized protein LOC34622372 n=1 Tax=Cyclospora cayetanensis TaxID=88456 RepID=A0A6P6S3A9_9EIME|nr:uncharacterized protein LOC34622372 [Cyclospora cayetanensis]
MEVAVRDTPALMALEEPIDAQASDSSNTPDSVNRSGGSIDVTNCRIRVERRNTIGFKCDKDCTSQPGTTQQPVDNVEPYQLDQRYEDPLAEVHQCSSLRRGSHLMASELLRDVKSPTGLEGDSSMSTDKNVDDLLRSDILSNKKSVADLGGESEAFDDADAAEARWEPQNDLAWGDNRVQQGSVELSSGVALSLRKLEGKDQSKQGRGELFKPFDGTTGTGIFDQGSGSSSTMIFVGSHGVDGTQHVQTAGSVDAIRRLSAAHISSTSHNSTISKHGSYEMGFAEESNERPKLQLNAYSGDSGNPSITSWDSSKQPSETQQDFQDEALEDRRRDKLLLIWVGTFALAMAVAFLCLGTFAILAGKSPEESPDTHIAVCETAEWGEWTVCPTACGKSEQIRTRAIKAAPGEVSSCPSTHEKRTCNGACMTFVLTREASTHTTSLSKEVLISQSFTIRSAISEALRISENRITLSGLGLDSTTGTKYWRVQFVFLVDKSLANSNPDADLGQDPQRTIALETITEPVDMCILLGPDAPSTCSCKVSEWSEWTVCDQRCTTLRSSRTRTVLNINELSTHASCPTLQEERSCTGQTRLYSFNLPAGLNLGSQEDAENRLSICADAVRGELPSMGNVVFDDQMLSISAPEYSRFVENDTIHGLWKFSVLLEPHISTEEAAENLDEAMQNSESNLFNAVAECMATTDVSSFVPLPSIAVSPGKMLPA